MPYVNIPNDLSRIKNKIAFNLTKRQIICFIFAIIAGVPLYFICRSAIGNSFAMLIMIAIMLPFFILAMYEKDGLPAEKVARNILRVKYLHPRTRPYKTENFFNNLTKEETYPLVSKYKNAKQTQKGRSTHSTAKHSL